MNLIGQYLQNLRGTIMIFLKFLRAETINVLFLIDRFSDHLSAFLLKNIETSTITKVITRESLPMQEL